MRTKLKTLVGGGVIVEQGCEVTSSREVEDEVILDGLGEQEIAEVFGNPRAFSIEKNEDGKVVGLRKGKARIGVSPAPRTPPAKQTDLATKGVSPTGRKRPI